MRMKERKEKIRKEKTRKKPLYDEANVMTS
jgi:hypothetical protein